VATLCWPWRRSAILNPDGYRTSVEGPKTRSASDGSGEARGVVAPREGVRIETDVIASDRTLTVLVTDPDGQPVAGGRTSGSGCAP